MTFWPLSIYIPPLSEKLQSSDLHPDFLGLLKDFFAPRLVQVIVNGVFSESFGLEDTIFQGAVLGPLLWITFFANVSEAARSTGGWEVRFADDLSVIKFCPRATHSTEIFDEIRCCQCNDHA